MSGFYNCYTFSPKLNFTPSENSTSAAVTVSVNYNTIDGYVKSDVPILSPYGFISMPDDNANGIYLGTSAYNAIGIAGYTNSLPKDSNMSEMVKGESGIFSAGNFTLKAKLDALISTFTNNADAVITTILPISENIVLILIDIMKEIRALEAAVNTMVSTYNLLTHPVTGSTTTPPNQPQNSYTETSRFTNDYTFINTTPSKMYININGEVLT
jgi:hypothetical protein